METRKEAIEKLRNAGFMTEYEVCDLLGMARTGGVGDALAKSGIATVKFPMGGGNKESRLYLAEDAREYARKRQRMTMTRSKVRSKTVGEVVGGDSNGGRLAAKIRDMSETIAELVGRVESLESFRSEFK